MKKNNFRSIIMILMLSLGANFTFTSCDDLFEDIFSTQKVSDDDDDEDDDDYYDSSSSSSSKKCGVCRGTGYCKACQGTGIYGISHTCGACKGTGDCSWCHGTGKR